MQIAAVSDKSAGEQIVKIRVMKEADLATVLHKNAGRHQGIYLGGRSGIENHIRCK